VRRKKKKKKKSKESVVVMLAITLLCKVSERERKEGSEK